MQTYFQLELNKLSVSNYNQICYLHAKFHDNRYLSRKLGRGVVSTLLREKGWKNTTTNLLKIIERFFSFPSTFVV